MSRNHSGDGDSNKGTNRCVLWQGITLIKVGLLDWLSLNGVPYRCVRVADEREGMKHLPRSGPQCPAPDAGPRPIHQSRPAAHGSGSSKLTLTFWHSTHLHLSDRIQWKPGHLHFGVCCTKRKGASFHVVFSSGLEKFSKAQFGIITKFCFYP